MTEAEMSDNNEVPERVWVAKHVYEDGTYSLSAWLPDKYREQAAMRNMNDHHEYVLVRQK